MPASKKQKAANRRNAEKSTGPHTPEGKAASSRNATNHGFHARDIILKSPHLNEGSTQSFPEKIKISKTNPFHSTKVTKNGFPFTQV